MCIRDSTYVAQRDYKKIDLSYMDEITGNSGVTAMLTRSGMETVSSTHLLCTV